MSFVTIEYYIFLMLVVGFVYVLRKEYSWLVLLSASYLFYASIHVEYSVVMLASTVVAYFSAVMMSKTEKWRLFFFLVGILTDLSLLFVFKYYSFFLENFNYLFQTELDTSFSLIENIILPIGISFYTFQSLSYTIDVFRRKRAPEKHFGYYALYISFFPQLVAGPIEQSQDLIPQLKEKIKPKLDGVIQGGKLILWGLFKKVVIADTIGAYSSNVYANSGNFNSIEIAVAVYAFAFQVYYDFSGYSNIAIGSAKMFGVDLSMNFNNPLVSKSITELWTRWHVTLMTFLKEYIYVPLIKNGRVFEKSKMLAVLFVFIASGLWHGASWNFVFFGLLNGLIVIIERQTFFIKKLNNNGGRKFLRFFAVGYTVSIFSFTSIWFKTVTNGEALETLSNLMKFNISNTALFNVVYILSLMIVGVWLETYRKHYQSTPFEAVKNNLGRISLYATITVLIVLFTSQEDIAFIYYQF